MKRENYSIVVYCTDPDHFRDRNIVLEELFYSSESLELMRDKFFKLLDELENNYE